MKNKATIKSFYPLLEHVLDGHFFKENLKKHECGSRYIERLK